MKYYSAKRMSAAAAVVACMIGACSLYAQEGGLAPLDESQFSDSAAASPAPAPGQVPSGTATPKPDLGPEPELPEAESAGSEGEGGIQNAVMEGVQISSEPGDKADEKVISCYFIFRDKPTSYFYDLRTKEKKIVFEFNDTKESSAPIPSTAEPPILGFTTEQRKIDINKDVKGLKPEWHTQVKVTFKLNKVPEIHVSDEYNVISFSYKWTTDPNKEDKYVVKEKGPVFIIASTATVAGVGGGVLAWYIWFRPKPKPLGPIPIDDLPVHNR